MSHATARHLIDGTMRGTLSLDDVAAPPVGQAGPAYVSIRQHTSAYVSIRQHTSACVSLDDVAAPPVGQACPA